MKASSYYLKIFSQISNSTCQEVRLYHSKYSQKYSRHSPHESRKWILGLEEGGGMAPKLWTLNSLFAKKEGVERSSALNPLCSIST